MAYSKRDYLNLREKMDLYILLQAQDAIQNIAKWPWLDGKKKWYIAANDYATAKIEDVLALEEGDPEE